MIYTIINVYFILFVASSKANFSRFMSFRLKMWMWTWKWMRIRHDLFSHKCYAISSTYLRISPWSMWWKVPNICVVLSHFCHNNKHNFSRAHCTMLETRFESDDCLFKFKMWKFKRAHNSLYKWILIQSTYIKMHLQFFFVCCCSHMWNWIEKKSQVVSMNVYSILFTAVRARMQHCNEKLAESKFEMHIKAIFIRNYVCQG